VARPRACRRLVVEFAPEVVSSLVDGQRAKDRLSARVDWDQRAAGSVRVADSVGA